MLLGPATEKELAEKAAIQEFESALGFGELPWFSKSEWDTLRRFVVKLHQSDPQAFQKFQAWRSNGGKFEGITNAKIRQNPKAFKDTYWPSYLAANLPPTSTPDRPELQPFHPQKEENNVTNPFRDTGEKIRRQIENLPQNAGKLIVTRKLTEGDRLRVDVPNRF